MKLVCDQCGHLEEPVATGYLWVNTGTMLANGRVLPDWRMFAVAVCSEFCAVKMRRDNKLRGRFVSLDGVEVAAPSEDTRPHELPSAGEDQERSTSPLPPDEHPDHRNSDSTGTACEHIAT